MKYLYTNNPDKYCHDFGDNVHGRPVHDSEERNLIDLGWVRDASKLPKTESKEVKETEEESVLSRDELAKSLGISLHDDEGKKLHYKLIDSAIKEAQANEHNEG